MGIYKIKKDLQPITCDCKKCVNWLGSKKGCRLRLQDEIRDGKCLRFGTYLTNGYQLTKDEKAEIRQHNKCVDDRKKESTNITTVKLSAIQKACEAPYLSLDFLRGCSTKIHPGNGRYTIEVVAHNPLTIKIKGPKGPRRVCHVIE